MSNEETIEMCSDGVLSIIDSAKFLGCSRSVVYDLMNKNEVQWTKVLGSRKIPRRELVAYLARNAQVSR